MSQKEGTSSNVSVSGVRVGRPIRSRTPSTRKSCACECQPGQHESLKDGRGRTDVQPSKDNANVKKAAKVVPDVLPSAAKAKSSVQPRSDALKNTPSKGISFSFGTLAPEQEIARLAQVTAGDVKEVAQVNHTPKSGKQPPVPLNKTTPAQTATPRQIKRKEADPTPSPMSKTSPSTSKLTKPAVPVQAAVKKPAVPVQAAVKKPAHRQHPQDIASYYITWDGFGDTEYRLGRECSFCERDLAVGSGELDKETKFSQLPVVAMLSCGHAFHAYCLDQADFSDNGGDPPCVFCASTML